MMSGANPDDEARIEALLPHIVQPVCYSLKVPLCKLGRSSHCDIVVNHPLVSREHAIIEMLGEDTYILRDRDSKHGTFIKGYRVYEHLLVHEDEIGMGRDAPILRFFGGEKTAEGLAYDAGLQRFLINRVQVDLTPQEFRLLKHLYDHYRPEPRLCSRRSCIAAILQTPEAELCADGTGHLRKADADMLNRVVGNVRKKLQRLDPYEQIIQVETIPGHGYRLI